MNLINGMTGSGPEASTHEEGHENGCVHEHQSQDGRPTVTETSSDRSSQEDADKRTALARLEKRALPFGLDTPFSGGGFDTICLGEFRKSDEVAVQKHIERLHNL
jgi:hypothetical protein